MPRHPRLLAPVLLLALLAPASPASATPPSGVLANDASSGRVAAYGDTVAWSAWDPAAGKFRLIVRSPSGVVAALPVRPQSSPFDVSAGRGPDGHTWLVWARCTNTTPGDTQHSPRGCHVVRWNTAAPGETRIGVADRRGHSAYAPSIDGDRLVYADAPSTTRPSRARVLVAALDGTSVRELPAIPSTTCSLSIEATCVPTTFARVWTTAIHGSRVAVGASVAAADESVGICGLGVLRLLSLGRELPRTVSQTICGLSGSTFAAAAFDGAGRPWWLRTCPGDESGCLHGSGGPFRLDPASGTTERLTDAGAGVTSLALAGSTPVVGSKGTGFDQACYPQTAAEVFTCGTVRAFGAPAFARVTPKAARTPDEGWLPTRTRTRLQVLRPPAQLPCGADLWAGAFTPPVRLDSRHQRFVRTPAIRVVATSPGRFPLTATSPATQYYWRYARLRRGGRAACGRMWTITYRATASTPAVTVRVRVGPWRG